MRSASSQISKSGFEQCLMSKAILMDRPWKVWWVWLLETHMVCRFSVAPWRDENLRLHHEIRNYIGVVSQISSWEFWLLVKVFFC